MAETTSTAAATPKMKTKPVAINAPAFDAPKFEMPKFEMPKFEVPKFEVPTAFREFAEKGIAQAKENYDKVKSAAEQATDVLEDTYSTASKGCASYGLKLIETTRANSDAAFDLMSELMSCQVLFRDCRALERLHAQAVRHHDRPGQGAIRARAKSSYRNCRADQGKHQQHLQQGRLTHSQ